MRSQSGDVLTPVDLDDQRALLRIARRAIEVGLAGEGRALHDDERSGRLGEPGASFVTLRQDDDLLGCIGTMEPSRPLADDVAANAHAAAFADPRLPPVTWEQLAVLSIKISVLGPLVQFAAGVPWSNYSTGRIDGASVIVFVVVLVAVVGLPLLFERGARRGGTDH